MTSWAGVLAVTVTAVTSVTAADGELLFENSDFESGTLKNWTAEGKAFAVQPTKGDNPTKRGRSDASGHQGEYWIGTYESYDGTQGHAGRTQGDGLTGRLTSVEFTINRNFINFLVGAGAHAQTSVRLLVDGKTYHLASGRSSETMVRVSADVQPFKGHKARLVLLDNEIGGWGHINADSFTVSEQATAEVVKPVETKRADLRKPASARKNAPRLSGPEQRREMMLQQRYLLLPIRNGAAKPSVSLAIDGQQVRFVTAELAPAAGEVDWWAFLDLGAYQGRKATLTVSGLTDEGFALIRQSDSVPGEAKWGSESRRPQFHFSQKVGWNNDPNGMVYYQGEWHLYFQHNPVGCKWGNMTWGHAVSKNLVHWEQLPNALHHRKGDAMFSGGAAVDWKNAGGWQRGDNDVLIATWTSTGRGECIAYSNDRGRTFTEYAGNPIIKHSGRDPKPVWYAYGAHDTPISEAARKLGGHWVIAVFDQDREHGRCIAFHTSADLKAWTLQSKLPGYFECAELFPLPVDGNAADTRWVVFAADARYAIGRFDGRTFTPEHEGKHQLHWGSYYASQTFSDAPDGRRIQIGWARINMRDMPFNQTFSFPTELTLRATEDGIRMFGEPVKEIGRIHGRKHELSNEKLVPENPLAVQTSGALFDIRAVFEIGSASRLGLDVDGRRTVTYDVAKQSLDGKPLKPANGRVSMQLLIDRPMMDVFGGDGRVIATSSYDNDLDIRSVAAVSEGGEARLVSLQVYELDAAWK